MFIEVDDGVVFVDEPNRAIAVLQLSDPIANRITSHVRLLRRHYNEPAGPQRPGILFCMIGPDARVEGTLSTSEVRCDVKDHDCRTRRRRRHRRQSEEPGVGLHSRSGAVRQTAGRSVW